MVELSGTADGHLDQCEPDAASAVYTLPQTTLSTGCGVISSCARSTGFEELFSALRMSIMKLTTWTWARCPRRSIKAGGQDRDLGPDEFELLDLSDGHLDRATPSGPARPSGE